MQRIKLVVFNEHTLGYIVPELPKYMFPIRASILKGATFETSDSSKLISSNDKVRLASEQDFDDFRVCFGGFGNESEYEFAPCQMVEKITSKKVRKGSLISFYGNEHVVDSFKDDSVVVNLGNGYKTTLWWHGDGCKVLKF
jgi:hypothetical protein